MSRGVMGVFTLIGVIIVVGLLITHSSGATAVENATFGGIGSIIKDLENIPSGGSHG